MRIDSVSLTRFRNYHAEEVAFCPGMNLLTGPNGHGKTNLLEAIHYACLAHSQRTRKDKELIEWNESSFVLRLRGRIGDREHVQSVEYTETGAKRVKVEGRESKRLSDLIGHFSVVSFSPEDLDLIRSGPQIRRRFLDILLCQFSAYGRSPEKPAGTGPPCLFRPPCHDAGSGSFRARKAGRRRGDWR